jgi:hypothetical protein
MSISFTNNTKLSDIDAIISIHTNFRIPKKRNSEAHKEDLKIYYDSQCGTSIRFLKNKVKPFYEESFNEFKDKLNLSLVPGALEMVEDYQGFETSVNEINFRCKHGEEECLGNSLHACALNILPKSKAIDYILCFMSNIRDNNYDNFLTTDLCSKQLNFLSDDIKRCATGRNGSLLMLAILQNKNKLSDTVSESPWVILNSNFNYDLHENMKENMTREVCSLLKDEKTKICKEVIKTSSNSLENSIAFTMTES